MFGFPLKLTPKGCRSSDELPRPWCFACEGALGRLYGCSKGLLVLLWTPLREGFCSSHVFLCDSLCFGRSVITPVEWSGDQCLFIVRAVCMCLDLKHGCVIQRHCAFEL